MNNSYQNDSCELQEDVLEDKCDNICSCENYEDDCGCGFEEGYNVFLKIQCLLKVMFLFNIWIKHSKPCVGLKMGTIFSRTS